MREIGKLKYVNPRELWEHEALHFTPWLSQHLDELGEAVGISLELINQEEKVGSFSCDIFAKESHTERKVVIENQLEPTDHCHLGQLMTYAAGLEAEIICWISLDIRDEHKLAIDWLNNQTSDDVHFFAVRLRAVQVDDSPAAPLFVVICSPNAFQRGAKTKRKETELRKRREEFWAEVIQKGIEFGLCRESDTPSSKNYQVFKAAKSGFRYDLVFTQTGTFSVELYITYKDSKELFNSLEADKEAIERELGFELSWQPLEHAHACRIAYEKPDIDEIADREELIEWSLKYLPKMKAVFDPRILKLMEK